MKITTKGEAGGIPVYCAFDEIVPVEQVKPNPKNPNQHPDKQIELLAKIIKEQGWRAPVTVSTRSGLVVRGHGRLQAAIAAGLSRVPVDYQSYDSEESELADLIADNRLSELADLDKEMLFDLFQDMEGSDFDMFLTGYSEEEIAKLGEELSEDDMLDIDDINSKSEVSTHKMKIDSSVIELTDDEFDMISAKLNAYLEDNGTSFGFVRWILNDN